MSERVHDYGLCVTVSDQPGVSPLAPHFGICPALNSADHWYVSVRKEQDGMAVYADFKLSTEELSALAAWATKRTGT